MKKITEQFFCRLVFDKKIKLIKEYAVWGKYTFLMKFSKKISDFDFFLLGLNSEKVHFHQNDIR